MASGTTPPQMLQAEKINHSETPWVITRTRHGISNEISSQSFATREEAEEEIDRMERAVLRDNGPKLAQQLLEAEIQGARKGFLAAWKMDTDRHWRHTVKEALAPRTETYIRETQIGAPGILHKGTFYRYYLDEDARNLVLTHYLSLVQEEEE